MKQGKPNTSNTVYLKSNSSWDFQLEDPKFYFVLLIGWDCIFCYFQLTKSHQSVQSISRVWIFMAPWTAARQASLSIPNSWSLLKLMAVMPSNYLILCHPLLLPSIFPTIKVFSNESVLCIRLPKYWSLSFSISPLPINFQDWFPWGWTGWISL